MEVEEEKEKEKMLFDEYEHDFYVVTECIFDEFLCVDRELILFWKVGIIL